MSDLTSRDRNDLIDLLGLTVEFLQSSIESCTLPGERWPRELELRASVAQDRRDIRTAERLIRTFREAR